MTRVIHTGDTHVGYRQYHSPERRRDFLAAFEQVIADAIADDVDTVVHAGDLFHDRRPGLVDLQGVIAALRDLAGAGIPFLAVVGNHETKRDAQWLDLFEDLGLATRLGSEPVEVGNAAFYGLDFVARSRRADLDYEFAPSDADHAALVAHGLFEPFAHADWDTERLLRESTVDFDVLLLGDDHEPKREEVDGTLLTYCGSTERVSASERDERGYNIVSFESESGSGSGSESDGDGESGGNHDRNRVSVLRRGLDVTREFVFVDLELQEGEGEARGREAVRQYDPTDAVVVVTIEGDGDPVTPAAIEEFANERGALIARVNDRREVGEETESEVAFTDPDEAVRERVLAMSLSEAAREVDETVRDPQVANANVRETVERRVREYVDAGELSAFSGSDEGAAVTGSDPEPENVRKTGGEGGGTEIGTDADIDPDTDADIDPDTDTDIDPDTDTDIDPDTEADTGDDGDQMSVEEFL
jgi:DNA repair exonuclease SbcCD nuclease subunit